MPDGTPVDYRAVLKKRKEEDDARWAARKAREDALSSACIFTCGLCGAAFATMEEQVQHRAVHGVEPHKDHAKNSRMKKSALAKLKKTCAACGKHFQARSQSAKKCDDCR